MFETLHINRFKANIFKINITMKLFICILLVSQLISFGNLQKPTRDNGGQLYRNTHFPNNQVYIGTDKDSSQVSEDTYSFQSSGSTSTTGSQSTNDGQNAYRTNYQTARTYPNDPPFTRNPNSFSGQKTHQTLPFDHIVKQIPHQVEISQTRVTNTGPRRTSQISKNFEEPTTEKSNLKDQGQTRDTPNVSPTTNQIPYTTLRQSIHNSNQQGITDGKLSTDLNDHSRGRSAGNNRRIPSRRRPKPITVNDDKNLQVVQNDVSVDSRCESTKGQFAHPDNCALFYNCWDSIVLLENCPSGLFFDAENHYCDYPQNVNCGARTQTEPPVGTELCPTLWGLFPKDCTTFYNCIDGVAKEVSCPEGLAFNQVNNTCDYPEKVSGCEDILPYQCSERYGKFPKGDQDCKQFWLCVDGNARLLSCPRSKNFDPIRSDCQDEAKVQC